MPYALIRLNEDKTMRKFRRNTDTYSMLYRDAKKVTLETIVFLSFCFIHTVSEMSPKCQAFLFFLRLKMVLVPKLQLYIFPMALINNLSSFSSLVNNCTNIFYAVNVLKIQKHSILSTKALFFTWKHVFNGQRQS